MKHMTSLFVCFYNSASANLSCDHSRLVRGDRNFGKQALALKSTVDKL